MQALIYIYSEYACSRWANIIKTQELYGGIQPLEDDNLIQSQEADLKTTITIEGKILVEQLLKTFKNATD